MHHFKSPCLHCGQPHDKVEAGSCKGDKSKAVPLAYCSISVRPDGVEHFRVRMSSGSTEDIHCHVSNHSPYYHFGYSENLIQPPRYDKNLAEPSTTPL